jgi:hypothetical protein
MSLRSAFRGHHFHLPPVVTDVLEVLALFAFLLGLAALLSYLAPWS